MTVLASRLETERAAVAIASTTEAVETVEFTLG